MFYIEEELKKIPDNPGVYIMKDSNDIIIYVGKAISLKKRVRQYFADSLKASLKVHKMVESIARFEYMVTDNEVEALILESNLIKKHRPKYNVLLKDDKNYPCIKITVNEPFPRVFVTRKVLKDGAKYFGPYTQVESLNRTMDTIRKIFPLRTCTRNITENKWSRPCLNYHIKRCNGPCAGHVSREDYGKMIEDVIRLLNGKYDAVVKNLEMQMHNAAQDLNFELAASLRDKIHHIRTINEKQKVLSQDQKDRDVIAYVYDEVKVCVEVFFIRTGKLLGRRTFFLPLNEEEAREVFHSFMEQFYAEARFVPDEVLLMEELEEKRLLESVLSEKKEKKVSILTPQKGEKYNLVQMVKLNASIALKNHRDDEVKETENSEKRLQSLSELLSLPSIPHTMEAFDISNTGSTEIVASLVVFKEGLPHKAGYRRFQIKQVLRQDDYASMKEVIFRRYTKLLKDGGAFPDLVFVDGGMLHVRAAQEVLGSLKVLIPVFGLVKDEKHRTRAIVSATTEYSIPKDTALLRLLVSVQDEAHRFALEYNKILRKKRMSSSVIDRIPGVGPKKKKILVKAFGSIEGIGKATLEQLTDISGIDTKTAKAIVSFFRDEEETF
jgi:excinuclease ABC subunit C